MKVHARTRLRERARPLRHAALAGLAIAGIVAAFASRTSWASDHQDAPSLVDDPGVDIADVYTFMRPGSSSHLVLAMTVHPNATGAATFDTNVEYKFLVFGYDAASGAIDPSVEEQVACRFQSQATGPQLVVCSANGFSAAGSVGGADAGPSSDPIRIFAGVRADPAFGDVAALKATLATKQLALVDAGGVNAFAGKNVLALVVELDVDQIVLGGAGEGVGTRPLFAVSATTERL